jgi:sugar/nucleoside kinase (ribokinase family)
MYSGLSDRGDANDGRDLADFIKWCRKQDAVTIVDSHTLTGNPAELIKAGRQINEYRLLEPLLPELDVFFTSCDEAKLIENTLATGRKWENFTEHQNNIHFLEFLTERFWQKDKRTKLFGVTVSNGAYQMHTYNEGRISKPEKIESRFMAGEVVDLVGAGDSFRAGLITYIASSLNRFCDGSIDFNEALQMGNLFASLFIKASLEDRYGNIKAYDKMLKVVRSNVDYPNFEALRDALN